ncbi:hypothetical protein GF324_12100 [bacterium]|nr:hypothetical protein [bacterium]
MSAYGTFRLRTCCYVTRFCLLVLLLHLLPVETWAGLPKEPLLRVETGMHTANIWGLDMDRDGRYMVTAAFDKTLRVWDPASGRLLKTLRPPIGPGHEGKLFDVAVSPDGRYIACSGYTRGDGRTVNIYIFNRVSGEPAHVITGLPNVVYALAFSPDGKRLAVHTAKGGLRVYDGLSGELIAEDRDYGHVAYGLDISEDGRIATSCYDGLIRLYGPDHALLKTTAAPGGKRPRSVAFSPDGTLLAVGYADQLQVDVLNVPALTPAAQPDVTGLRAGHLSEPAWSTDGHYLFAAGTAWAGEEGYVIRAWPQQGRGTPRDIACPSPTVFKLHAHPDGGVAFVSGDPAWGLARLDGTIQPFLPPRIADLELQRTLFRMSDDGLCLLFGLNRNDSPLARFSLRDRVLLKDPSKRDDLLQTVTRGTTVEFIKEGASGRVLVNNEELDFEKNEKALTIDIAETADRFIVGASRHLYAYRTDGTRLWQRSTPEIPFSVKLNMSGTIAAAAFGDGTIRWYRMSNGTPLLHFFPHTDGRWVVWTPEGYYDCSPGAEDLIGWHINRGVDKAADFYGASRFRDVFYRPDIIDETLQSFHTDEPAMVQGSIAATREASVVDVETILPPTITILSPESGVQVSKDEITIRYRTDAPANAPVTTVRPLVDGRPAQSSRGIKIVQNVVKSERAGEDEIVVPIPPRDCELSLIAENRHGSSEPVTIQLTWDGRSPQTAQSPLQKDLGFVIKPKLYILAVGVGAYRDASLQLKFPARDARDFANVMKTQEGLLYREVVARVLIDSSATKGNILDGLDWIVKETTSHDVAMIFFAGHGINDPNGTFYYLPHEADTGRIRRTMLPYTELEMAVRAVAGKVLMFMDACHSGNVMGSRRGAVDITAAVNTLADAENGAVVYASSTGRQYSLEDSRWANGAFTEALVEGLSGQADYIGKHQISVNMLDLYLAERVKELTEGRQTPTTTKPQTIPDFPIAIVK